MTSKSFSALIAKQSRQIKNRCQEENTEKNCDQLPPRCPARVPMIRLRTFTCRSRFARAIVGSLQTDLQRSEAQRQEQVAALQRRLTAISTRMGQIYEDKLDRKIDEQFWTRKQAEYREQERTLEAALSSLSIPVTRENVLTIERIFELANKAQFLYFTRNPAERGKLLRGHRMNLWRRRTILRNSLVHESAYQRSDGYTAHSLHFPEQSRRVSLHLRLCGGESGIRSHPHIDNTQLVDFPVL
ncbi:MAG: hypothetical protein ABSD76_19970 [Terriglobales bacterium]